MWRVLGFLDICIVRCSWLCQWQFNWVAWPACTPGSSPNWKPWEEWYRETGLICLPVCLLPSCPGLYCVHVQARLKTDLLVSCVPQWMLLLAYLPFFSLSVLRKLTCILFWVCIIFPMLHPLCRKSSIKYMWETCPSPFPHFLAHSLEEFYYL